MRHCSAFRKAKAMAHGDFHTSFVMMHHNLIAKGVRAAIYIFVFADTALYADRFGLTFAADSEDVILDIVSGLLSAGKAIQGRVCLIGPFV